MIRVITKQKSTEQVIDRGAYPGKLVELSPIVIYNTRKDSSEEGYKFVALIEGKEYTKIIPAIVSNGSHLLKFLKGMTGMSTVADVIALIQSLNHELNPQLFVGKEYLFEIKHVGINKRSKPRAVIENIIKKDVEKKQ
jgi:hypothetical protein